MTNACGICLVDEAEVERGKLDCCEHFFCFACILEWSKVESRCPFCKQRFVSIAKPSRPGARRSVVRIPTRNQAYEQSDEEAQIAADSYAAVVCSECFDSGEDDGRMLLCDGCDAAAHTNCVGLDCVPRGGWFCSRCLADNESASEDDSEDDDESYVVGRIYSPRRPKQQFGANTSSALARTLSSQRAVQERIHYFRQNWEKFRNGVEEFVSEEKPAGDDKRESEGGADVSKAWKMMERAKKVWNHQANATRTTPIATTTEPQFKRPSQRSRTVSAAECLKGDEARLKVQEQERPLAASEEGSLKPTEVPLSKVKEEDESSSSLTGELPPLKRKQGESEYCSEKQQRSVEEGSRIATSKSKDNRERRALKEGLLNLLKEELEPLYKHHVISRERYKGIARAGTHILLDEDDGADLKSEALRLRARLTVKKLLTMGLTGN